MGSMRLKMKFIFYYVVDRCSKYTIPYYDGGCPESYMILLMSDPWTDEPLMSDATCNYYAVRIVLRFTVLNCLQINLSVSFKI
jgi:hypothetical protein